jgi:hypothetical protein
VIRALIIQSVLISAVILHIYRQRAMFQFVKMKAAMTIISWERWQYQKYPPNFKSGKIHPNKVKYNDAKPPHT